MNADQQGFVESFGKYMKEMIKDPTITTEKEFVDHIMKSGLIDELMNKIEEGNDIEILQDVIKELLK